jgi:hypothetical protein
MSKIKNNKSGTIGSRKSAGTVEYKEAKDQTFTTVNKYAFSYDAKKLESDLALNTNFTFIPPSFVKARIEMKKGEYFHQNLFMIPTEKNKMRLFLSFHQSFLPSLVTKYVIPSSIGKYFSTKSSRKVIYQDNEMLIGIKENNDKNAKEYSKIVNADIMIKRYRDEYLKKALKNDPWFKGFNDIEDLVN